MIRGNIMLLQVLSGLSHSAVHGGLVDPREEDHHGHDEGFQRGFPGSWSQIDHSFTYNV